MTRLGLLTTDLRKDADASLSLQKRQFNKRAIFNLLERCHHLDVAFNEWHDSVPASWQCDLVGSSPEEPDEAPESWLCWPGEIHRYENIYLARNWNSYRSHRIAIQAVAVRCLEWLADYSAINPNITSPLGPMVNQPLMAKARNTMQTLVDSICASIPFLMGVLPNLSRPVPSPLAGAGEEPTERHEASETTCTRSDPESSSSSIVLTVKAADRIGPFFSLHSLLVAVAVPNISMTQRRWILGRIKEVAKLVQLNPDMIKARLKENTLGFNKIPMDDFT